MANQVPHAWSKDAFLAKSQLFFTEMLRHPRDDWQFAHWSTLALELLSRAALSNISATLLADEKNWNNTYYALGFKPKAAKFSPISIGIQTVFARLREILPDFTTDMESFGAVHMARRNDELHSGVAPFDGLSTSKWLPHFYETCSALAASNGKDLAFFIGKNEAALAVTMITAARDESAKAVMKSVAAHKTVWEGKQEEERNQIEGQATIWATRQTGHRVKCPACACDALLDGVPIAEPLKTIDEDEITERQQYLPARFECVGCGLKISNYAQLSACNLGGTYTSTSMYSASEYYIDQFRAYVEGNNENF